MAASAASGTQVAVVGTEHTLATIVAAGTYQLQVDTANLGNGDTLLLQAKLKVTGAGTTRLAFAAVYEHGQGEPVKLSVPIPSLYELVFTLKQVAGTARSFPWEVVKL